MITTAPKVCSVTSVQGSVCHQRNTELNLTIIISDPATIRTSGVTHMKWIATPTKILHKIYK